MKVAKKKERLHQTAICITILLVGKQPTCTGDRLADVGQRAQVGLLGLVAMFPEQRVRHLLPQLRLQHVVGHLVVRDHLYAKRDGVGEGREVEVVVLRKEKLLPQHCE